MHASVYMPGGRNPVKLRAWQETSGHINRIPMTEGNKTMNNYKTIKADETTIAKYNGASIRNFADAWRKSGRKLPKLTLVCTSQPVRTTEDGTTKVLVEGRYTIGAIVDGKPMLLGRIVAELGYKIPLSGSKDKCLERIEDLKAALNQTGKYTPRKSGAGNVEGSKPAKK